MKHFTFCIDCNEENPELDVWAEGEVNSNLTALCVCPKGHKSVSGLMHNLFDVLYFSAVDSFLKGCYSESVMSFAASLERTYEMFIKVSMFKEGLLSSSPKPQPHKSRELVSDFLTFKKYVPCVKATLQKPIGWVF